ncbi:MAG: PfkB family carbohydrate kinase, partial [Treponema sp.]|nr:PfkB family carbohydrate kinase [Treponema sp.]
GAGDTFCACILHDILENGYDSFSKERLTKMLTFANAASSLITTKKGALCVMPDKNQIEELMKS